MIEAFKYGQNPKGFDWIGDMIDSLKPIELPSDKDVCDKVEEIAHNYFDMHNTNHYKGLKEGAKRMGCWFVEQIKQQSNGN